MEKGLIGEGGVIERGLNRCWKYEKIFYGDRICIFRESSLVIIFSVYNTWTFEPDVVFRLQRGTTWRGGLIERGFKKKLL